MSADTVETQRETALRIARQHGPELDRAFTTNGVLPSRDIRLLLDITRILSAESPDGR
jgi:hypothetical protein